MVHCCHFMKRCILIPKRLRRFMDHDELSPYTFWGEKCFLEGLLIRRSTVTHCFSIPSTLKVNMMLMSGISSQGLGSYVFCFQLSFIGTTQSRRLCNDPAKYSLGPQPPSRPDIPELIISSQLVSGSIRK